MTYPPGAPAPQGVIPPTSGGLHCGFMTLTERYMSVCQAEAVLRWRRVMADMERPDRDRPGGGMEVIPRLAIEDQEAQIRAIRTRTGAVALGHQKVSAR